MVCKSFVHILVLSSLVLSKCVFADNVKDSNVNDGKNSVEKQSKNDLWSITASYSPWFVNWEQKSTAANQFGSNVIDVDYAIDGAIAHSAILTIEVMGFEADFQLVELPESAEDEQKSLSTLSAAINYTDFVGDTSLHYTYRTTDFTGSISGDDGAGRDGQGTFKTEALSHDISLLTSWGLGVGFRTFSYDLPQDVYLVKQSDPLNSLYSGFNNIEYSADFFQVVFAQEELLNKDTAKFNLGIKARYGFGTMNAGGEFIDGIEKDEAIMSEVIGDGDASFVEFEIYGYMPLRISEKVDSNFKFGYRSSVMSATFKPGETYSLVTDFETNFSGPYIALDLKW